MSSFTSSSSSVSSSIRQPPLDFSTLPLIGREREVQLLLSKCLHHDSRHDYPPPCEEHNNSNNDDDNSIPLTSPPPFTTTRFVLVEAASGMGKTFLVQQTLEKEGEVFFLSGKHENSATANTTSNPHLVQPMPAIFEAVESMMMQLIQRETEEEGIHSFRLFKEKLKKRFTKDSKLIKRVPTLCQFLRHDQCHSQNKNKENNQSQEQHRQFHNQKNEEEQEEEEEAKPASSKPTDHSAEDVDDDDNMSSHSSDSSFRPGTAVSTLRSLQQELLELFSLISCFLNTTERNSTVATTGTTTSKRRMPKTTAPLILFLDDLQWSCSATLEFIKAIVGKSNNIHNNNSKGDGGVPGILIVGTMRKEEEHDHLTNNNDDDDIGNADFARQFQALADVRIPLGPLDRNSLQRYLETQLQRRSSSHPIDDLMDVIFEKTRGHAFFVSQFLQLLVEDHLFQYDFSKFHWNYDALRIRSETDVSDNVVGLLVCKMRKMCRCSQKTLHVGALLGHRFDVTMVKTYMRAASRDGENHNNNDDDENKSENDYSVGADQVTYDDERIDRVLEAAVKEGLVYGGASTTKTVQYRFCHDRIREAAYQLAPTSESAQLQHVAIGRILLQELAACCPTKQAARTWKLIAVEQFNYGLGLVENLEERTMLADLNLESAKITSQGTAFRSAAAFCRAGLEWIPSYSERWEEPHFHRTLSLSTLLAEMEYCLGNRDRCRQQVDSILNHATKLEEKFTAYKIKMESFAAEGYLVEATNIGLDVLLQLGLRFPSKAKTIHILTELIKVKWKLRQMTDEDILALPELQEKKLLGALDLMTLMGGYAYSTSQTGLMLLLTLKEMQILLKHGVSKYSADALVSYGVLMGQTNNFKEAYRFGQLCLKFMDRFHSKEQTPKELLAVHFFLNHLRAPVHDSIEPLLEAHRLGMSMGDIRSASLSFFSYICCYVMCGLPLAPVVKDADGFIKEMSFFSQDHTLLLTKAVYQSMLNFMGLSQDPLVLASEDEFMEYAQMRGNEQIGQIVYMQKAILANYFGDFRQAGENVEKVWKKFELLGACAFMSCVSHFIFGLSALGMVGLTGTPRYKQKARKYIKKLRNWARQGEPNVVHMILILEAEQLSHSKDKPMMDKVQKAYNRAISSSRRSGFMHNAALANERAGLYCMENGDDDYARDYFQNSFELYSEWGAEGKVKQLEEHFDYLNSSERSDEAKGRTNRYGVSRFDPRISTKYRTQSLLGEVNN